MIFVMTHTCLGWRKLTLAQSLEIPKKSISVEFHGSSLLLSNRSDVDFFSSSRDPFTMREYPQLDLGLLKV